MGCSYCRYYLGRSSCSLSFEELDEAVGKIDSFAEVGIAVGVDIGVVDTAVAGTVAAASAAEESAVDTAVHTISDSPSVDYCVKSA